MKTTFTTISTTEKAIEVTLAPKEFLAYLDQAARKLSQGLEIPGFRKGNAPRDVVEQRVGSSGLYDEAAELAVSETYKKALKDSKQQTVGSQQQTANSRYAVPEIQVVKIAPHNPFVYKIILRAPIFMLAENYKTIAKNTREKEKKEVAVEDIEVEESLNWLAKNRSSANSQQSTASGKQQSRGRQTVKIDDGFARSLGDFNTVEDLKKSIREGIFLEKEKKEKDRIRLLMVSAIVAESKAEIPEKVIDREVLKIEEEFTENISQMGLELDAYLKKIKKTKEELRAGWREQARERVETALALDAIADREKIEPEDKEVKDEAQKVLSRFKNVKDAKKEISSARLRAYVRGIIKNEKTFTFLENV